VEKVEDDLILRLVMPSKGQSLLDVGCGTGNHLLMFQRLGLDVTGIDPSSPMLRIARDKLGQLAELHVGVAEDLPFEDNSFDIVTLISSLEFCTNPFQALAEAFRVARERVFFGVLNRISANSIQRRVEGFFRPSIYRYARFYSIWELKYMIRRVLGICRMEWGSVIWFPLPLLKCNQRLDHWMPRRRNPFGAFLGLQVEILYTRQAILDPLSRRWVRTTRSEAPLGTSSGMGSSREIEYSKPGASRI
jgi:SAM-dependent methyltransferase